MLFQKLLGASPASAPIGVTFLQTAVITNNSNQYTFSNQNIGTASTDRIVLVGISALTAVGIDIQQVTVGGIVATRRNFNGPSGIGVALYSVAVSTGTTATVVVNFSGASNDTACCGIALWRLTNADNFRTEAFPNSLGNTSTAASQTFRFNQVKSGDAIIVMSRIRSANAGTYSMTGATERFDMSVETDIAGQFGGDVMIGANQSNYDVVISTSGASPLSVHTATRFFT
jgi:hypothetical protein